MRFAAGRVDITPAELFTLAGWSSRSGPASRVESRLEANAVVFFEGDAPTAIVTVDLLYVGADVRQLVLDGLKGRLQADRLFMAASHTHSAPATASRLPALGKVEPGYGRQAAERVVQLLTRLFEGPLERGEMAAGRSFADHSINRRRRQRSLRSGGRLSTAMLLPNLRGPRDETVTAVVLRNEAGQPGCVLWSYACHPVGFPDRRAVSAEYPGAVRTLLRRQSREDLPVLFLQGFSGDTRPRAIVTTGVRGRVRTLLNRHMWQRYSAGEWDAWARSLGAVVQQTVGSASRSRPLEEHLTALRVEEDLAWAFSPVPEARPFSMHLVSLGPALRIVGVSAEPVSSYSERVRRLAPPGLTLTAGCIDEPFGYLPAESMLHEGGYEVDGFRGHFGIEGQFRPGVERRFLERAAQLLAGV